MNGAGTAVATGDACTELVGQAPDGQDPVGFATAAVTEAAIINTKKSDTIVRMTIVIGYLSELRQGVFHPLPRNGSRDRLADFLGARGAADVARAWTAEQH